MLPDPRERPRVRGRARVDKVPGQEVVGYCLRSGQRNALREDAPARRGKRMVNYDYNQDDRAR